MALRCRLNLSSATCRVYLKSIYINIPNCKIIITVNRKIIMTTLNATLHRALKRDIKSIQKQLMASRSRVADKELAIHQSLWSSSAKYRVQTLMPALGALQLPTYRLNLGMNRHFTRPAGPSITSEQNWSIISQTACILYCYMYNIETTLRIQ